VARAPLTFRRLSGLDRSGPPPPQTVRGAPLHPWTLPNLIAFARLCFIPVFLAVALSDDDGHSGVAAALFAIIGWSDYLDGIVARVTGQYSRFGALLDPVADRLLVVSGMVVAWRFDLLPRWAIGVLVARELYILVLGRIALSKGGDVHVNWPGRLAVAPVLGAPFFAMCGLETLGTVLLYVGLALSLWAAALYTHEAIVNSRTQRSSRA
jgi:CDP-diacylglycerol--glycerol-3-phosphate 3-phosphatidyltransferase